MAARFLTIKIDIEDVSVDTAIRQSHEMLSYILQSQIPKNAILSGRECRVQIKVNTDAGNFEQIDAAIEVET